jgi:hypothetical protein
MRIPIRGIFPVAAVFCLFSGFSAAGSEDMVPPQLISLGIAPTQVDITDADAKVTVTARITDNLAGNAGEGYSSSPSQIRFRSPSGRQFIDAILSDNERLSGTAWDGNYGYEMTIPRYAETGVWMVEYALLVDQVGNMKNEGAADLVTRSMPVSFVVTGTSDTAPPQLVSLGISPAQVDVTNADVVVSITAQITDNLAGNAGEGYFSSPSQIRFRSPSGNQFVDAILSGSQRMSGTALDGNYGYEMTIPRYAETGMWIVEYALLVDQVGNIKSEGVAELVARSLPVSFVVTGISDTTAPQLVRLGISPRSVDVSNSRAKIAVTAKITDDLSGNAGDGFSSSPSQIRFRSPSGGQFVDAILSGYERVNGTALDGNYAFEMSVPKHAETGVWRVESVLLVDQVGNMKNESATNLAARGLPTSLVVRPVLQVQSPAETKARSAVLRLFMKSNSAVTRYQYRVMAPNRKTFGTWKSVRLTGQSKVRNSRQRIELKSFGTWQVQVRSFDAAGKVSGVRTATITRKR